MIRIGTVAVEPTLDIDEMASADGKAKVTNSIQNYKPEIYKTVSVEMNIVLKNDVPISTRPRRLPLAERCLVDDQVDEWLKNGIIEESESEYSSAVVLVKKRDGGSRLCVDYRRINKVIVKDRFPLPLIEDQLDRLQNAKIFSTIDLKNGFFMFQSLIQVENNIFRNPQWPIPI